MLTQNHSAFLSVELKYLALQTILNCGFLIIVIFERNVIDICFCINLIDIFGVVEV